MCTEPGCGAHLKTKWNYKQHMKRHLGLYHYYCPYCNKGLGNTLRVKEHLQKYHTGLLGYHCLKCSLEFDTVHLLKEHLSQKSCNRETGK